MDVMSWKNFQKYWRHLTFSWKGGFPPQIWNAHNFLPRTTGELRVETTKRPVTPTSGRHALAARIRLQTRDFDLWPWPSRMTCYRQSPDTSSLTFWLWKNDLDLRQMTFWPWTIDLDFLTLTSWPWTFTRVLCSYPTPDTCLWPFDLDLTTLTFDRWPSYVGRATSTFWSWTLTRVKLLDTDSRHFV